MAYKGDILGNCQSESPLTGFGSCDIKEGKTKALIFTERNATYSLDDAEFLTEIQQYVNTSGSKRMTPIKKIEGATRSGGDVATSELGNYGTTVPTGTNGLSIVYVIDGGDCFFKELLKFRKRNMRVFRVDDSGYIFGTVVKSGDNYYRAGFDTTSYPYYTEAEGTTAASLSLSVSYTDSYEEELMNKSGFEIGLLNVPDGLLGITIRKGAAAGTATVVTNCGGTDITEVYSGDWDTTMFLNASGANPTSVVYADGKLSFTPSASAYRIAGPDVLKVGDIAGYEGIDLLVDLS